MGFSQMGINIKRVIFIVLIATLTSGYIDCSTRFSNDDFSITTKIPLPQGTIGEYYTLSLSADDGEEPYTWIVYNVSALPPGLNLIDGTLSGTPTTAGNYNFNIVVYDVTGDSTEKNFSLTIQDSLTALKTSIWTYSKDVYEVTNHRGTACSIGEINIHTITVHQNLSTHEITFSGFFDDSTKWLSGFQDPLNSYALMVEGSYSEGSGTLTARLELTINSSFTHMSGIEYWSWTDADNTCIHGEAHVQVTKN